MSAFTIEKFKSNKKVNNMYLILIIDVIRYRVIVIGFN